MPSILESKKLLDQMFLKTRSPVSGTGVNRMNKTLTMYVSPRHKYPDVGLPSNVYGHPVNTIYMETPSPISTDPCAQSNTGSQAKYRPLCGGISAAHYLIPAGTLGAIMRDIYTNQPVLLSNNHVFANMSSVANQRATKGDAILQPSSADRGNVADKVATLERWIPYDEFGNNLVDAAIGKPLPGTISEKWESTILAKGIGEEFVIPEKLVSVTSPINVRKYGRTGGLTAGKVMDWDFSTTMPYPTGITVKYVDQLLIRIDTCAGDSGAVYLDENDNIVGLHAGGTTINGERYAVANKIKNVAALLGLSLN